jgi:hypothetical protein
MPKAPAVPVGPQTVAGYTFSLAAFVTAILAFIEGDRSQETLFAVVMGAASLVALVVTNVNRSRQAQNLARLAVQEKRDHPDEKVRAVARELHRLRTEDAHAEAEIPPPHTPGGENVARPTRRRPQRESQA